MAQTDIHDLMMGCEAFKSQYGVYPPQNGWQSELTGVGHPTVNFRKIQFTEADFADPWGSSYMYQNPGKYNPKTFDIYSLGKDRLSITGGADSDDIASWRPRELSTIETIVRILLSIVPIILFVEIIRAVLRKRPQKDRDGGPDDPNPPSSDHDAP